MNNPEKLTAFGTHDEDKQNKNRSTMCVGQQTSFLSGNRNGYQNSEDSPVLPYMVLLADTIYQRETI